MPATRIIPRARLAPEQTFVPAPAHSIRFVLDKPDAKRETVQPGVTRWAYTDGFAWEFDLETTATFARDGVQFTGRRGGIVVDQGKGQTQLAMLEGERIGYRDLSVSGGDGPYTITFERDRVVGRTAGLERFIHVTRPEGLDRLPVLVVDGQTYAPGTSADFARGTISTTGDPYNADGRGGLLIVPILPGEHSFELRALDQPPVFRNWQAWPPTPQAMSGREKEQ